MPATNSGTPENLVFDESNPTVQTFKFDSEADVILSLPGNGYTVDGDLKIDGPRPLVHCSSDVLRNASPVFAKMLTGNFKEASMLRESKRQKTSHGLPVIELQEDDPVAMLQLLKLLHFQGELTLQPVWGAPYQICEHIVWIAAVAIHATKYGCFTAVRVWVNYCGLMFLMHKRWLWIDLEIIAWIVVSSMCAQVEDEFAKKLHAVLSWHVQPGFLKDLQNHRFWMVPRILGDYQYVLGEVVEQILAELQERLYNALEVLSDDYSVKGRSYLRCNTATCPACSSTAGGITAACAFKMTDDDHITGECDSSTRHTMYFKALKEKGLFPTHQLFKTLSPSQIHQRLLEVRLAVRHSCDVGDECPLIMAVKAALDAFEQVRARELKTWEFPGLVFFGKLR